MRKIFKKIIILCFVLVGTIIGTASVNANDNVNNEQNLKPDLIVNVKNEKFIDVVWTINDQEKQIKDYKIYYKNLQAEGEEESETVLYDTVESTGASEYTVEVSNLSQNRQYEFYVEAVLKDDTVIQSDKKIVMTKGIYLSAENIDGEVSIYWDYNIESGDVQYYNIYLGKENEDTGNIEYQIVKTINGGEQTIYTFYDLMSNKDYWIYVEAVLENESKIKSAVQDISTEKGIEADLTPISGTEIYLSWKWDKSYYGDFTQFKVYKLVSDDETTKEEFVGTTNETSYIVRNLDKRSVCHFKIVGITEDGEEVSGETGVMKTPSFGLKATTISENQINLEWDYDGSDGVATKYNVYRSMTDEESLSRVKTCDEEDDDCDENDEILVDSVTSKSYVIKDLKKGQSYNFIIEAVLENDNRTVSSNYVLSMINSSFSPVENKVYNGKSQKQDIRVLYDIDKGNVTSQELNNNSSKTMNLENDKDYEVVYKDNVNVGTAKVIIKGKGIFAGQVEKTFKITAKDISTYKTVNIPNKVYNGKVQMPAVTVLALNKNDYYVESYKNNINVGIATVVIKGKGNYTGTIEKTFKITKAKNSVIVKAKNVKVKSKKLKNKNQVVSAITTTKARGKVSYAKVSGNKKILVNSKTGKITIKKKIKKGTYKIKVKINAAGNKNYKAGSKTVTLKVKVK